MKIDVIDANYLPDWTWSFEDFYTRFERNILNQHLRHARELDLPATLTMYQWYSNVKHFNGKCAYCQKKPWGILEHFISLSAGGGTTSNNCVPACQSCNVRKAQGTLHPDDLYRVQAYLERGEP